MKILKRDGSYERLSFDKILYRIRKLANDKTLGTLKTVDPDIITQRVVNSIYDGISSWELDEEAARISVGMTENPEYPKLAARIVVSNLHKSTIECFSEVMEMLYGYKDESTGYNAGIISDEIIEIVRKHKDTLNFCMDFSRDYNFDYFGFKTLQRSYLLKINKRMKVGDNYVNKMITVERPQHMYLRVALGLFGDDIPNVLKTYDLISRGLFTFASPTLFNAATRMGQLSSCFTGDTIVTTVNRGPVCIQDICIGDQVISHLGNVKSVVQVHRNYLNSRKLYKLDLFNNVCIQVTDNHPLYVISGGESDSKPFWKNVEDLSDGDYISIPNKIGGYKNYPLSIWVDEIVENGKDIVCKGAISVDNDFAKFLALHYAFTSLTDSFFSKSSKHYLFIGRLNSIQRTKKMDSLLIDWYLSYIKKNFGFEKTHNHLIFETIENLFGTYEIFWKDIWSWHSDLVVTFVETLVSFSLSKYLSVKMLDQLYYLLRNNGFPVSYNHPIETFENNTTEQKFVKFLGKKEIKDTESNQIVYTLGVEDDHSYNVGGIIAQNCFLLGTDDSIDGIFKTITDCAKISKVAGGIGVHISNIRGKGSLIRGTHGTSDGIIPMLKVYNDTSLYINQCLVPETIVYSRRGPLRMDEVETGDVLITSDGTFQSVTKIHINQKVNDRLLEIVAGGVSLKCTDVHHILVQIDDYPLQFLAASDILYYFNLKKHELRLYFPKLTYEPEYSEFVLWTATKKEAYQRFLAVQTGEMEEYPLIEEIKTFNYTGPVYDFTVNWNHNYLTNAGIVHNSGKRKGSFAIYLEPWHSDIFEFLDLKKNQGHDNVRARDLFYALWIPDLFMKRVEEDADWYLMCPDECPGLTESHSSQFEELYLKYISEGRYRKKVKAQDLWFKILEAQMETGTPYMLYKDSSNRKSNQRNYGTIKSSNLCVSQDTLILTKNGYLPIGSLDNCPVTVWNGWEWSNVTVQQTGSNQKLLHITLNDGTDIRCTEYHKFYDKSGRDIRAGDLVPGTTLMMAKQYPIVTSLSTPPTPFEQARTPYLNGLLVASGSNEVPINENIVSRVSWLEGFFDGFKMAGHTGLCFTFESQKFIKDLKLFFHTIGINPVTSKQFDSRWNLQLTVRDIQTLKNLGLKSLPILVAGTYTNDFVLEVDSVKSVPGLHDTFCFTEPLRGMGIFNGILTGQCSEIILYSDPNEVAVCNLSSIALPKFIEINGKNRSFNFTELKETARFMVHAMNKVIDANYYAIPEAKYANLKHRPLGLGVQGLYDSFVMMNFPFESSDSKELNRRIFETIYYGAIEGSIDMAEQDGPYETYHESPAAQGLLQFDLWAETDPTVLDFLKDSQWDWSGLKERMKKFGLRNCMLTTCMPTASTAQILGNTECIEPIDSCIFKRRVLSGDFTVINRYLVEDLEKLGLWSNEMKERIIINNGSVQGIPEIPDDIRALYKTVWEISQKTLIDYSADRGPFIDHSQSLNLFVEKPTLKKLTSMHFYGWKKGLKTGMYYLRSKSAGGAAKFSVDASLEMKSKSGEKKKEYTEEEKLACSLANPEACEACSG